MQETDAAKPKTVRARAFVVGLILVLLVCLIVGYSEFVASKGGSMDAILLGASHMPPAAIGVLLALLAVNVILRKIAPKWRLQPAELAVIYVMTVCAALLSSFALSAQLLPNLVLPNYFANQQNEWGKMFFMHLPRWIVPFDPKGPDMQPVAKAYFEGLRQGESIPWGAWVIPLAAWTVFALLLIFLMACLATLLRRQWVDNEKLSFPLVQLPLEMVEEGSSLQRKDRKLMMLGALVPFIFHGMNGLHNIIPNFPAIQSTIVLNNYLVGRPWTDMIFTPIAITFSVIGFAYLLPLDVSFSMWFFMFFFRFQDIIGSSFGYQYDSMPLYGAAHFYQGYQGAGAAVAVCFSLLWLARPHLKLLWERVRYGQHEGLDSNEMMSYRVAFWGAVASFVLIVLWCNLAGMSLFVAAFTMFCFVFFIIIMMTRCAAEVGLLMLQGVFRPVDIWGVGATRMSLGAANLAPLALLNGAFIRDPRVLMPVFMDGMKLSDGVKLPRRKLALGIALAIPVAVVAAYGIHLWIVYRYGAVKLNAWFFQASPTLYFGEARSIMLGTNHFDIRAPAFFSVGLIFTFFLYIMRARFWWWPFHPLGYAIGAAWPITVYWFAFFVGWLAKSKILKYGGIRTFRMLRPFFLGLIFGEFITAILWATLCALLGSAAPNIPLT